VFANLLQNAAKYTGKGGRIRLTAERCGDQVEIRVSDTGIGIPREKLDNIFELFVQVDNTLERTTGGLGIGLTLAQRLVAMHGGRITARSDGPGKGSEFIVQLPLAVRPARETLAPAEGSTGETLGGLRILVADDNPDAASTLAQLLRLLGHDTRLASDGNAALSEMAAFKPDAAILDIGMPGLNGYEVAQRVRSNAELRRVFLIALTGWGQEGDKTQALEAGFDAHLTKPARIEVIQGMLARLQRGGPNQEVAAVVRKSPQGKSNPLSK
jgi:CheY-like chemotaxis protein